MQVLKKLCFLNEKCNSLVGSLSVLFISSVVEGSKYWALINSCAECSFENKKDIMAHSYFQHNLVWKANRTSN